VSLLSNPFWHALTTEQASFAVTNGPLRFFPGDVAPFCAVERDREAIDAGALEAALDGCAVRYFVGRLPDLPRGFRVSRPITLLQMAGGRMVEADRPAPHVRDLGPEHIDAMLALTGLVFPGFFRRRTVEMGRYIGVFEADALVAMGGERLAMPGYRELSAICTHPGHTGKGYGRSIVSRLTSRILAQRRVPFLHVRETNTTARRLYESLGFTFANSVQLLTVNPER
jgi:ribosomal protein S18 acetylase RimI-like enzyme